MTIHYRQTWRLELLPLVTAAPAPQNQGSGRTGGDTRGE
jgi:hypothetical protein